MCLSGKCLYFDGSGDYVDIAPDPAIEAADDDKYTWSVWVRPLDVSTQQIIMSATDENGFGDGNTAGEFNIGRTSGTCEWTFGDNGDNTISVNISTSSDWQHWVGVKNGLNIDFYINGFLRGSKTNAESGSRNPLSLRIGSPHAAERFFHGFLDEVKIYPYARTADQIKQDYAAGLAGIGTPHGIAAAFGSKSDNWMSDGLVGYWKFDEPAGTYDDDGDYDDAIDSSGNGITGDADMSASTTAGKYGNSLIMESGDAMYYGDNLGFESNNPFSIFLWLNTSYDEAVILRKMVDGETYCGYQIYLASSDWRVNIRSDDTTDNTIDINGLTDFGDGEWHYVGFTYDGSSRAEGLKLYVDGENDNGSVIHNSLNGTIDNDAELALGMGVLAGRFDEVRIYNRALSPDEIRKLYEWAPGPVAYWKFDEHTGTTAFDSAASTTIEGGNHGTLTCDGAGCTKPTWVRGKYGGALNFSANTSDEDRVTFPGDGIWDDIPDAFTAMAWVKIRSDGGGDQGRIIDCGDSIGPFIFQMDATNNPGLQVFNNDGYEYHDPDDCDECIPLNEWHHIAATWVAGTSTFYLDGINIGGNGATYGYVYGNLKPTSGVVAIGNRPSSTMNRDFDGAIDEIKIYTYARTQKQILQDMAGSEGDQTLGRLHPALELHFDEGKGGTAYDSSGYGNNGTLYPGTTGGNTATSAMWDLNGKFGKAIEFDGTNDYISISDNSSLDIGATNSVSVAAWVRVNSWGADEGIVCKTTGSGSANVDYCLGIQDSANDDGFEFYVGSFTYRYSYPKKSLNTWYHVIGTYDGSNIYMYINGEREDGLTAGASKSASNAAALEIGRWYTRYFHGLVDSAQVFPYVLTATEAKALYNQSAAAVMGAVSSATTATSSNAASRIYCVPGSTDYCVPPVGEWTFNEKTGTTTYDTSGNGNDGVFVSAGTSPTWQAAHKCRYGSCLEFDGSDDYAQISADSTIDDMATATISMWFNLSSVAGGSFIVKDPGDTGAVNIYPFPDQRLALTRKYSSSHMEIFCPVSSFSFNKWTHLSATYAGRYASNARIYLNGVDCGQVNDNGEGDLVSEAGDPLYIGRLLTGFLDQVRIYNYARTPAQIAWEYNRGEPVAWWDFNECQGGTIHDQSYNCKEAGTCNHGTLILGSSGVTATGTCASSSSSTFWGSDTSKLGSGGGSFDGESDYIDLGIGTLGYQYLSVSAWFKYINYSSCDGWDGLVSKDDGYDFILGVKCGAPNINNVVIWMSNTVGGSSGNIYSTTVVNDSTWHHALATFNGSKVRLYIDGEFENEGSLTGYVDDDSDARMTIGSYDGGESLPDRFMKGNIDEVKIWNYALTAEQVKTEYAGGAVRIGE